MKEQHNLAVVPDASEAPRVYWVPCPAPHTSTLGITMEAEGPADDFEERKKKLLQPVLFEAGAALLDCQGLEFGIALLLFHFSRLGAVGLQPERVSQILDDKEKKTAGQLVAMLKKHVTVSKGIETALEEALVARNYLVHRVLIDMAGDSILAIFEVATGAVSAALSIQQALGAMSGGVQDGECLHFRIGVHLGEIVEKTDGTVYGDGVNVAARLQALAEPGGIAVSDAVKGAVGIRVCAAFADQGEAVLKNIPSAIRWHRAVSTQTEGRTAVLRARTAIARTADELSELPSIAILPFKTATADVEQICFADGLRTDIQWALAKIAGLVLIGTPTTNTYRDKAVTPQEAAAQMGARYLLEGFFQKSGHRARITVSLIKGSSAQVIWTEHYDRTLNESLEVQDEITEKIVTALDVKLLSGDQARVWRKAIRHPKAREHFYRGIYESMKGRKEANAAARDAFEQVARLAPESSIGPTAVALTHWWDAFRGWSATSERSLELAEQWANRAMPMEDVDGQAHTVMAHIHLLRREYDKALEVAEDSVALRPGCSTANAHLGNIYYYCGRPADAADRVRQAMRLTPVHPAWFKVALAASCKEIRQWSEANAAADGAVRMKHDDIDARLVQIEVCNATGMASQARQLAQEISALRPDFSVARWAETQPYKDLGALERITASLRSAGLNP